MHTQTKRSNSNSPGEGGGIEGNNINLILINNILIGTYDVLWELQLRQSYFIAPSIFSQTIDNWAVS